jgi:hypothetical protein
MVWREIERRIDSGLLSLRPHSFPCRLRFAKNLDERNLDEYLAVIDNKLNAAGREDWNCLTDSGTTTRGAILAPHAGVDPEDGRQQREGAYER